MHTYLRPGGRLLLAASLLIALLINLESAPPLWWDEGWTLSVARNWVDLGHYGRLLEGQPFSAGLQATIPVTGSIALSFRILGVGIYQGRLAGVVFTLATLALMYHLARRLYNDSVALGMLSVLILMSPHREIHPLLMGRQALAEMPALFFLLAGYACFFTADRSLWALLWSVLFWSAALITKLQVLPFWLASLLLPLVLVLVRKNWKQVAMLGAGVVGSLVLAQLLLVFEQVVLERQTHSLTPVPGLYHVTAIVWALPVRAFALFAVLFLGVPTLLGLGYAAWGFIRREYRSSGFAHADVVRLALLTLSATWFAWYLSLSAGWVRYLFPSTFTGSAFVSAMLSNLTGRFSIYYTITHAGSVFRHLSFSRENIRALLAVAFIGISVPATLSMLYQTYVINADTSVAQVAEFLNTQTPPNALIETYDSELFFLLERRYHYPPDEIHVALNRRAFLREDVSIDYDPLKANPDYLVVGPHSRLWRLYDPVVKTGAFRLVRAYSRYDVYERVH
jgi:hypothetical protein